jgi:hypothetical protein
MQMQYLLTYVIPFLFFFVSSLLHNLQLRLDMSVTHARGPTQQTLAGGCSQLTTATTTLRQINVHISER